MATFQPPPTWAPVVLVDERTKDAKFNPVWLKWFVDLVGIINESGGTTLNHNDLSNIQGGTANQYYHMTAAEDAVIAALTAGTKVVYPTTPAGAAQTAVALYGNSGAPNNAQGANGDFYFRSDGTVAGNTVIYHKEGGAWVACVTA